ncbi:hypothetical protein HU200_044061 [Digitaria exilis]|uniref:Uncharacterized protein n=1 Tax=Digitaria exilis TaxID=1010633 RepID=A0A835B2F8_9POAL|nr:hypothetical protein HU200_044061 [Digitaria exilis]
MPITPRSRVPELAAGSPRRRPSSPESTSDMAGCPLSPRTRLASADSALATASPPRTAGPCRRRRCPPVQTTTFAPPRAPFPRPVSSRLAHARLPPAARLRARRQHGHDKALSPRDVTELFPSTPSLPSHAYISQQQFPSLSTPEKPHRSSQSRRRARSRAQLSPLLPRPNRGSLELPQPPLPLTEQSPHQFPHQSPRRSSPDPLRSTSGRTEGTVSSLVSCWCSPTTSPSFSDPDVAAATAVVDRVPGHPRPRDLAQTNRGEPLFNFPYFPGPVSSPFGRRTRLCLQPLSRGPSAKCRVYELVPAAEEITQESEVNVVHVDPSPEQEYRFEPEGKPRSIT